MISKTILLTISLSLSDFLIRTELADFRIINVSTHYLLNTSVQYWESGSYHLSLLVEIMKKNYIMKSNIMPFRNC